jgi:hypothetical protein
MVLALPGAATSGTSQRPVYQTPQSYYLALGDSVAYGFQPPKASAGLPPSVFDTGYVDLFAARLRALAPEKADRRLPLLRRGHRSRHRPNHLSDRLGTPGAGPRTRRPRRSLQRALPPVRITAGEGPESGGAYQAIRRSDLIPPIRSPATLNHRSCTKTSAGELVSWMHLARAADSPAPTITSLIHLAGAINGIDYPRQGLTLERMGLAGKSRDEIRVHTSSCRAHRLKPDGRLANTGLALDHEPNRTIRHALDEARDRGSLPRATNHLSHRRAQSS